MTVADADPDRRARPIAAWRKSAAYGRGQGRLGNIKAKGSVHSNENSWLSRRYHAFDVSKAPDADEGFGPLSNSTSPRQTIDRSPCANSSEQTLDEESKSSECLG